MKQPHEFEDDGRVVADMSGIEGPGFASLFKGKKRRDNGPTTTQAPADPMSRDERRIYVRAATLAALAIGAVFLAAGALFILFCQFIWLR